MRNPAIITITALALVSLLLLAGCTSITKEQAEKASVDFVDNNVRFFTKEDNSTKGLPQYTIDSISSYKQDSKWVVLMHVTAVYGNETKKNDLSIEVDGNGKVMSLNGKAVPDQ